MSEEERLQLENELLMTCSKAQAINKYIDELEESSKLSELWCKSQQENQQLKEDYSKLLETSKAYKKLLKTTMQKEHKAIKVLDEIREQLKLERKIALSLNKPYTVSVIDKLLDKVKE